MSSIYLTFTRKPIGKVGADWLQANNIPLDEVVADQWAEIDEDAMTVALVKFDTHQGLRIRACGSEEEDNRYVQRVKMYPISVLPPAP